MQREALLARYGVALLVMVGVDCLLAIATKVCGYDFDMLAGWFSCLAWMKMTERPKETSDAA